jgi:RNA polymerase sigma-70 factor (ECF subfamily)
MRRSARGDSAAHEASRWIAAARRGDRDALGQLLESCRNYLLLVSQRKLAPDLRAKVGPSDLVQESLLLAAREFDRFVGDNEAEFRAWVRRILLNQLDNAARQYARTDKRQVTREVPLQDVPVEELARRLANSGGSPSGMARRRERDRKLTQALEGLAEQERQVIAWRNYERLSFAAIGERLDRSAEAARKVWGRALLKLRALLKEADEPR